MKLTKRRAAHRINRGASEVTVRAISALIGAEMPCGVLRTKADAQDYLWHALHSLDDVADFRHESVCCDVRTSFVCAFFAEQDRLEGNIGPLAGPTPHHRQKTPEEAEAIVASLREREERCS